MGSLPSKVQVQYLVKHCFIHSVHVHETESTNQFSKKNHTQVERDKAFENIQFPLCIIRSQIILSIVRIGFVDSMKWIIFNFCILLFYFVQSMHCGCCHYTYLYFETQGIDLQKRKYIGCEDFGASDVDFYSGKSYVLPKWRRSCKIAVCNDGQAPVDRSCAYGPCDGLGCNCDGDCIGGLGAVESFKFMYGSRFVLNLRTKY